MTHTLASSALGDLWAHTLDHIRSTVPPAVFRSWFEIITPASLDDDRLHLRVPSRFAREWIEAHYIPLIVEVASASAGRTLTLAFEVEPPTEIELDAGVPVVGATLEVPVATPTAPAPHLNPRSTFETFVIGASNRFSHAAAQAVAETPARAYNPLFIYGGVGLGKTHLLHAIGHYVLATQPGSRICYVSSETFTNDFISSVGDAGRIAGFKRRYRENDVLLVDDIQFLERKEATIEEFFHTFNTLYEANRQIVLTSDRPPKQLGLDERVRSRFAWGLITDVQTPDLETRIAIIRRKAQFEGAEHLSDDVLTFIASRVESNIRELEGALIRLLAFASLYKSPVSVQLAETVLKDLYPEGGPGTITPDLILAETARYFEIDPTDLLSANRSRTLVAPRHLAMYLCRELTDLSLPQIGARFGGRDHSTVLHACNKVKTLLAEQRSTLQQIQELTARIRTRAKNL
ncbi:MAG: chromosomal replication initiator protein DnaA [Actinomycetota bacterium]